MLAHGKKIGQRVSSQLFLSSALHMVILVPIGPAQGSASRLLPDVA